jgi:surface carbohydrate biosynthesis protein (TIGR04326 family)
MLKSSNRFFAYVERDLVKSYVGWHAFDSTLYRVLLSDTCQKLIKRNVKAIFYLQENQHWEYSLLDAIKSVRSDIKVYAVPHTTIRYWDLRYFDSPKVHELFNAWPDAVLTNGSLQEDMLSVVPSGLRTVRVESLRFKIPEVSLGGKKVRNLLFLGDFMPSYNQRLLNMIKESKMLGKFTVYFKSHPGLFLDESNFVSSKVTVETRALTDCLGDYKLVVASSTTSSILDAFLSGVEVACIVDGEALNLCPLYKTRYQCQFIHSIAAFDDYLRQFAFDEEGGSRQSTLLEGIVEVSASLPKWRIFLSELNCGYNNESHTSL